jgi:hypothetical protein
MGENILVPFAGDGSGIGELIRGVPLATMEGSLRGLAPVAVEAALDPAAAARIRPRLVPAS